MMEQNGKTSVKGAAGRHSSRRGAFSAGLTALVIAVVVVFNLLVGQLPERYARLDLTESGIYTISQTTVDYLAEMQEDVSIHVLADPDKMDTRIVRFLDKYVDLSDRLHLEYTDPTVYPSVLQTYGMDAGSIVVACEANSKQESFAIDDIIGYDMYSYYTTGNVSETDFDGEGLLTAAIDTVLSEASRKVYQIKDHDEDSFTINMEELLRKSHMSVADVNLLTDGGVPADCDLLVCNSPVTDLADVERDMILEYLAGGGQVLYMMSGDLTPKPNWDAILEAYGMKVAGGMIVDKTPGWYFQDYKYGAILPQMDTTVDAASGLNSEANILCVGSQGFTLTDPARETITVSSFLNTSNGAFSIKDSETQVPGTYSVGAVATEDTAGGVARLTVLGSDSLIDSSITESFSNLANRDLFLQAVTIGFDDITNISIEPVSLLVTQNTVTTGGIWSTLFILVLPLAVLLFGFVRWLHRRKL